MLRLLFLFDDVYVCVHPLTFYTLLVFFSLNHPAQWEKCKKDCDVAFKTCCGINWGNCEDDETVFEKCLDADNDCYHNKCLDADAITEVTTDFDVDIEDAGLRGHHLPVVADV